MTGAAKRIGRAIALRLHQAGYRVAIHYGTSEKDARATAEECGSAPLFQANLEKRRRHPAHVSRSGSSGSEAFTAW